MDTIKLSVSSIKKLTYKRGYLYVFKSHLYIKEFYLLKYTNMQRYVYYLKSFHKKHYTFTYQTWVAGDNSEAVWKTGFQYNVGNGIKM